MCSLIVLHRPYHEWPLLLGGNRDEMRDRPWSPPGRHWEDRPEVVAGLDRVAGGSWFGINDDGVVAVAMNRMGTLGPQAGKRSRGELVLEALDHAEAEQAANALADLETQNYRAFNVFIGDPVSAYWVRHSGAGSAQVHKISPGLHMLAATDLDDLENPRVRTYLPRFREAPTPDPVAGDWTGWQELLASRWHPEDEPYAGMNLDLPIGFGTVCSQLVAIPRYPRYEPPPLFLFAAGPPDRVPFEPVDLS